MKITVAGTGYVGLVTGVCLASVGYSVTCLDLDEKKVEALRRGVSPIYEKDLEEMMAQHRERITYTTDKKAAYADADFIFIGVGTPENEDGSANLSAVYAVADDIASYAVNSPIVAVKSTVPIGTCDKLEKYINDKMKPGFEVRVVSNPEFLAQGTAVRDTLKASRIVVGAKDAKAAQAMKGLYEPFELPVILTDRRSSEMIKYASNDFLALKISYINEIANLCELVGANIDDVATGMGYDNRIGRLFLKAGIGYGGSCFPKDTKGLFWLSEFHGYEMKTVKAAIDVNEEQKFILIKKSRKYYDTLAGKTVAVLGLTFKPGTDDLREAPSLKIVPALLAEGARVKAWDPVVGDKTRSRLPEGVEYCPSIDKTVKGADLCMILTEWPEVVGYDVTSYAKLMRRGIVIDGRNCYNTQDMMGKGVYYESVGRLPVTPEA